MATVIRAADVPTARGVVFNFEDIGQQAREYLDKVRADAAALIEAARAEADAIRRQAEQEGRAAAMAAQGRLVAEQLEPVLPALRQAVEEIRQAKQGFLGHWENCGIGVAVAIARRVIRRELSHRPEITLGLLREALELASGNPPVRIHLHPADCKVLHDGVAALLREFSNLGGAELVADAEISRGGCRVETRFGAIDQQCEAQLARIEEELTAC